MKKKHSGCVVTRPRDESGIAWIRVKSRRTIKPKKRLSCLIFKSILKNRHETKEYECTAGLWCGDRDYPVNDLVVFGDNIGTGGKSRDRSDDRRTKYLIRSDIKREAVS